MNLRTRGLATLVAAGASAALLLAPASPASAGPASTLTEPDPVVRSDCTVFGTDRNDVLRGTPGDDVICGFRGNDVLLGFGGDDVLFGGPGRDVLVGGPGHDEMYGEAGNDLLIDTNGPSRENGGGGQDRCLGVQYTTFQSCEHVVGTP